MDDDLHDCHRLVRTVYRTADEPDGAMAFTAGPAVPCGGIIIGDGSCSRCGRERLISRYVVAGQRHDSGFF